MKEKAVCPMKQKNVKHLFYLRRLQWYGIKIGCHLVQFSWNSSRTCASISQKCKNTNKRGVKCCNKGKSIKSIKHY